MLNLDEYRFNLGVNFKDSKNGNFEIPETVGRTLMMVSEKAAASHTEKYYPLVDCAGLF